MMLSHDAYFAAHHVWDKTKDIPTFSLVLASSAATEGEKHVDHYVHKGLLTRIDGVQALADWMGQNVDMIRETFLNYIADAEKGSDQWGKTSFQGKPYNDLDTEIFFVGTVTPVLHYCMGGITIDSQGNVLLLSKSIAFCQAQGIAAKGPVPAQDQGTGPGQGPAPGPRLCS